MNVKSTSIASAPLHLMTGRDIRQFQKAEDIIAAFFPRIVSPHVTALALRLGLSGNQLSVLWGIVNVAGSIAAFEAIVGRYELVLLVFASQVLAHVLDCSDGEVARLRGSASPIGGKLIDGVCHKATEVLADHRLRRRGVSLHCRRRSSCGWDWRCSRVRRCAPTARSVRILVIRVHAQPQKYITPVGPDDVYAAGDSGGRFHRARS
jgi:hypothetical protein